MALIKICGITNYNDAKLAIDLGADAIGFIFCKSKRQISPQKAKKIIDKLPIFSTTVGVFMNMKPSIVKEISDFTKIDIIQLHGNEPVATYYKIIGKKIIKRINPNNFHSAKEINNFIKNTIADAYLLDPGAGSGTGFSWEILNELKKNKFIIAGGLSPKNIEGLIQQYNPYGVDANSGLEKFPGKKDKKKLEEFIKIIRRSE